MKLPTEFEHFRADFGDQRLHWVEQGAAVDGSVLLLHGWPGFWWEYSRVLAALPPSWLALVPDLRGCGESAKPDVADLAAYRLERVVDDLLALIDRRGRGPLWLVGHDWGSMLVHKLLRRRPEAFAGAVLGNPIVPGFARYFMALEHQPESWYAHFHQLPMAADLVASSRRATEVYLEHFLSHWAGSASAFSPAERAVMVDNMRRPGNLASGFAWYRANLSLAGPPPWREVDQVRSDLPVEVLWGMADPVIPAAARELVASCYSHFRLTELTDVGHFVPWEAPSEVVAALRRLAGC
ncbi:MAG: alpha/beta hydrolase [Acidobacteriota bacterium]